MSTYCEIAGECHRATLMLSQRWFVQWLGAIRQRTITEDKVGRYLCRHARLQRVTTVLPSNDRWYVRGADMGPNWCRQGPGGPHDGPHEPCYLGCLSGQTNRIVGVFIGHVSTISSFTLMNTMTMTINCREPLSEPMLTWFVLQNNVTMPQCVITLLLSGLAPGSRLNIKTFFPCIGFPCQK